MRTTFGILFFILRFENVLSISTPAPLIIHALFESTAFNFYPLIIGLISSFFSSLIAIDFLLKYLASSGLKLFIYYRFIFAILIILNL